jgi:hypothetical protein
MAGLARRDGIDVKPTLLRVLTDFYVQKSYHPPHEEQHFIELALRLIDDVDAQTLTTVQRKLAEYPGAPHVVQDHLAARRAALAPASPPAAAEPSVEAATSEAATPETPLQIPSHVTLSQAIASHSFTSAPPNYRVSTPTAPSKTSTDLSWDFLDTMAHAREPEPAPVPRAAVAPEDRAAATRYSEQFFAADAKARWEMLHRLDVSAAVPPLGISREAAARTTQRLEAAALKGRPYDFVRELEDVLSIPRSITERIINDTSGELLLVIAKALAMPMDVVQRILLLLNPAIGTSVKRVFELSALYDAMTEAAALRLISLWRNAERTPQRAAPPRAETSHAPVAEDAARRPLSREPDRTATLRDIFPIRRDQRAS